MLIGGSSHVGKSTLAEFLASKLGWDCISTDRLARHPGRPWKAKPEKVPEHVVEHYLTLPVDELITDVLRHYRDNVWPIVETLVTSRATDLSTERLIMEGSALWPESVVTLGLDNVAALWLTASDNLFERRIYKNSEYKKKTPQEKILIDKFLKRTMVYNEGMNVSINRLGLASIDIEILSSLEELSQKCLELINS